MIAPDERSEQDVDSEALDADESEPDIEPFAGPEPSSDEDRGARRAHGYGYE